MDSISDETTGALEGPFLTNLSPTLTVPLPPSRRDTSSSLFGFDLDASFHEFCMPNSLPSLTDPLDLSWSGDSLPASPPSLPSGSAPQTIGTQREMSMQACTNSPQSCIQLGNRALRSLKSRIAADSCVFGKTCISSSNSHNQPQSMMDVTLAANREAMLALRNMVDCGVCIASPAMALVIIVICDRLASWNQAILRAVNHDTGNFRDNWQEGMHSSKSTSCSMDADGADQVQLQPVRVGDFSVDEPRLEEYIRASLVLNDLKAVKVVVHRLLPHRGGDAMTGVEVGTPFSTRVHDNLIRLLCLKIDMAIEAAISKRQLNS
ncbi:hypothetical protein DL768_009503 [Monosporascus sp. mg162]|nr:hypothetical protein DL768_009503 [Monosporascus sp. mg162]